jgi:hypothetical protein
MIEKSVDWNKAVELTQKVIPNKNINKIQTINNLTKINEYKTLVNFLFSKLSYSQKSKVNYLKYWQTTNTERLNKAKTIAKDAGGGCYIATMVYGDYEHPQVIELRDFRDNTLQSSFFGRSFIKFYYKYSPKLVELLKSKKAVNKTIRTILDTFIKTISK